MAPCVWMKDRGSEGSPVLLPHLEVLPIYKMGSHGSPTGRLERGRGTTCARARDGSPACPPRGRRSGRGALISGAGAAVDYDNDDGNTQ